MLPPTSDRETNRAIIRIGGLPSLYGIEELYCMQSLPEDVSTTKERLQWQWKLLIRWRSTHLSHLTCKMIACEQNNDCEFLSNLQRITKQDGILWFCIPVSFRATRNTITSFFIRLMQLLKFCSKRIKLTSSSSRNFRKAWVYWI